MTASFTKHLRTALRYISAEWSRIGFVNFAQLGTRQFRGVGGLRLSWDTSRPARAEAEHRCNEWLAEFPRVVPEASRPVWRDRHARVVAQEIENGAGSFEYRVLGQPAVASARSSKDSVAEKTMPEVLNMAPWGSMKNPSTPSICSRW